jgi:hypothetical protein
MTHTPDRRRDPQLRTAIDEYRELAARLKTEAQTVRTPSNARSIARWQNR